MSDDRPGRDPSLTRPPPRDPAGAAVPAYGRAPGSLPPRPGKPGPAHRAPAEPGHPQPLSRRARARSRRATARASGDRGPAGAGRARRQLRRRRRIVLGGIGVLTLAGAALAALGLSTVRNSTVGRYAEALAPTDPGYQAYVVATPTLAAVTTTADGELTGIAVLALEPGDRGGSVIVVPPSTMVLPAPTGTTPPTLGEIYARQGADATMTALGTILNAGVPDSVVVDPAHWERLVTPVAPIDLTLDRPVDRWKAGKVRLAAADVGRFLAVRGRDETDLDRIDRQERFWTAWLAQVAQGGDDAVPGEVATGLGRFVRGVASRPAAVAGLPVARFDGPNGVRLVPDAPQVARLVSDSLPFPQSPAPGTRVRVRLLNGTTDRSLTTDAARALVEDGAEVVIVGNALTFTVADTTIDYSGADRQPLADRLAKASGIERTRRIPAGDQRLISSNDEIDVTVILGEDARDLIGR